MVCFRQQPLYQIIGRCRSGGCFNDPLRTAIATALRQQLLDDVAVDVGQAIIAALKAEGQTLVIEA